jgi:hypothetical protein
MIADNYAGSNTQQLCRAVRESNRACAGRKDEVGKPEVCSWIWKVARIVKPPIRAPKGQPVRRAVGEDGAPGVPRPRPDPEGCTYCDPVADLT